MPRAPQPSTDDSRFSAVAALGALVGHALILALALWARPNTELVPLRDSVRVTLVDGGGGAPASDDSAPPQTPRPSLAPAPSPPQDEAPAGARLDALLAPGAPASAAPPSSSMSSTPTAREPAGPSGETTGSSRPETGLGPGETGEGIDLYAAASLPMVGQRPSPAPTGDLWRRVAPCWRQASPRPATLLVEIAADGRVLGEPQAVRTRGASDPSTFSAERAALRALQACAPYEGLQARRWRVTFQTTRGSGR